MENNLLSFLLCFIIKHDYFFEPIGIIFVIYFMYYMISSIWKFIKANTEDRPLFQKCGEYAVIIGVSTGVGRSATLELAKQGINLVIIDNDLDILQSTSEEIKSDYGVKCNFIKADFVNDIAVYQTISRKLSDKNITVLANFADVLGKQPCFFLNETDENIRKMITINMSLILNMIRIVLPKMLYVRRGIIINVTPLTKTFPIPYLSLYSSLKGYMLHLTKALEMECMDMNEPIRFQTLWSYDYKSKSEEVINFLRNCNGNRI